MQIKNQDIKTGSGRYTEDYIKRTWSEDYYIFDVRDYESIGKSEWKDWIKEISNQTVNDMVQNRRFINSGHSSYLIEIMIKEQGWTEAQIADYILQLRDKHLNTLKQNWKKSITNAPYGFKNDIKYLKEIYSHYVCCCKNLNENPEPFENLISKIKAK